ncbi:MAG: DUF2946 family protein [Xanthobacteraceae bacterium]|nr:DUF2946 family protein [Xanthobacteraceae bacterium]
MGWFWVQRRVGAWLALIALALQLGLAFGHVHHEAHEAHEAHGHAAGLAAAEPDGDDHGNADKDGCPSCAILNLLAGAQPGTAPVSVTPMAMGAGTAVPAIETIRPGPGRTAFRSRAPPPS